MTQSILICGAGGQVGQALAGAESEYRIIALQRNQLDITEASSVTAVFDEQRPDIVINAAAYTQVDLAEKEAEKAYSINRDGVANLATACERANIPLLHVSTDYVFDGCKAGAYRETDPMAPLGVYGESKAEGEAILRNCLTQHIILRTSWVFSPTGSNFVKTMLRLGKQRDRLGVVDDQLGCPTSAASIAATLLAIAGIYLRGERLTWGTYHYCNLPATSWYGFALEIFKQAGGYQALTLSPIASSDYPTAAHRPQNSVLDCGKICKMLGMEAADWREELRRMLG